MTITMSTCAGYRRYSRHPDRPGRWFVCDEPATQNGRCFACEADHTTARQHEAEDESYRAGVRAALRAALTGIRPHYAALLDDPRLFGLVAEIELAVKGTGRLGGSGNHWLALRVLLDRGPHDPVD